MTTEQTDNYLLTLLTEARTVAVVGISRRDPTGQAMPWQPI